MKTKLILFFLSISSAVFGQTFSKGDVLLEGSLNYTSINDYSKMFNFNPSAAYLLNDKFAIGLGLFYGSSKVSNQGTGNGEPKSTTLGGSIFGRYYFWELGSRFKTYGQLEAAYSSLDLKNYGQQTDNAYPINTLSTNASIGANYFLTEKVALGYRFANVLSFSNKKSKGFNTSSNTFEANINNFGNFFDTGVFSLTFKF